MQSLPCLDKVIWFSRRALIDIPFAERYRGFSLTWPKPRDCWGRIHFGCQVLQQLQGGMEVRREGGRGGEGRREVREGEREVGMEGGRGGREGERGREGGRERGREGGRERGRREKEREGGGREGVGVGRGGTEGGREGGREREWGREGGRGRREGGRKGGREGGRARGREGVLLQVILCLRLVVQTQANAVCLPWRGITTLLTYIMLSYN